MSAPRPSDWPFWQALLKRSKDRADSERLWNGCVGMLLGDKEKAKIKDRDGKPFQFPELSTNEIAQIKQSSNAPQPSDFIENGMFFAYKVFAVDADFSNLVFWKADFREAEFSHNADFTNTTFSGLANFFRAKFFYWSDFTKAKFKGGALFNNTEFKATTIFERAQFAKVPHFQGAKLHIDTSFFKVTWPLPPGHPQNEDDERQIENDMRVWEFLARTMNEQGRHHEGREFFSKQMRWRWLIVGWFERLFISAYCLTCDYGYGIGKAFLCWLGHIVIGGIVLSCVANKSFSVCFPKFLPGLAVSFSNAHAFLGLGRSWAENSYCEIKQVAAANGTSEWLAFFGGVQVVAGPILLFLLLLSLRHRFRIS